MSVYSGFTTRVQESVYNQCVCELLAVMQNFIIEVFQIQMSLIHHPFVEDFAKGFGKLVRLEKQKHMQPNFSIFVKELDGFLKSPGLGKWKDPLGVVNSFEFDMRNDLKTLKHFSVPITSKMKFRKDLETIKESPRSINRDKRDRKEYQDRLLRSIMQDLSFEFQ